MIYNFIKPLYLPSGGFEYSPICYLSPVTKEIDIFVVDKMFNSMFEYIITIINRYVKLPTNIEELFVSDLYYIWAYILITDIQQETEIHLHDSCKWCNNRNLILFDFAESSYNFFNRHKTKKIDNFTIEYKGAAVTFERRKVKHNLEFSQTYLNEFGLTYEFDVMKKIFYCIPQITKITHGDITIPIYEYIDFFKNMNYDFVKYVYNNIIIKENEFGIKNIIKYECGECKKQNITQIFNNIFNCIITPTTIKISDKEKLIRYFFNASSLDTFNLVEFLSLPLRYDKAIDNVLKTLKIEGLSHMTHYSDPYKLDT